MINKNKMMRIKIIDDLLARKKYPSIEDIMETIYYRFLELYGDETKARVSRSTIDKDLNDMRYNSEMFNQTALINYCPERKGLYYEEEGFSILNNPLTTEQLSDLEILLEYFKDNPAFTYIQDSIHSMLATAKISKEDQKTIIQFDRADFYEGNKYLPILTHAIKQRRKIEFDYNKTHKGEITHRVVDPYFLKEFEKRWYLKALDNKSNLMRTFELSRITNLTKSLDNFIYNDNLFDSEDYYKHIYGITTDPDQVVQEIVLSFKYETGKLFDTLKIHPSQEKIKETKDWITFRFKLYYYEKTYEIIRFVCKYANDVKVIQPESLKKEVIKRLKEALKQYE